jgi:hypothetical protein
MDFESAAVFAGLTTVTAQAKVSYSLACLEPS